RPSGARQPTTTRNPPATTATTPGKRIEPCSPGTQETLHDRTWPAWWPAAAGAPRPRYTNGSYRSLAARRGCGGQMRRGQSTILAFADGRRLRLLAGGAARTLHSSGAMHHERCAVCHPCHALPPGLRRRPARARRPRMTSRDVLVRAALAQVRWFAG